jgi:hypothetical protein
MLHVYVKEKTVYRTDAVLCMKKYGVDFERRNHAGLTAMECAVEVGRKEDWQWKMEDVVTAETRAAEAKNKK